MTMSPFIELNHLFQVREGAPHIQKAPSSNDNSRQPISVKCIHKNVGYFGL